LRNLIDLPFELVDLVGIFVSMSLETIPTYQSQ